MPLGVGWGRQLDGFGILMVVNTCTKNVCQAKLIKFSVFILRCMGIPSCRSTKFTKGNNCDYQFTSLDDEGPVKRISFLKDRTLTEMGIKRKWQSVHLQIKISFSFLFFFFFIYIIICYELS